MKPANKTAVINALARLAPNRRALSSDLAHIDYTLARVLSFECGVDEYKFLELIRKGRESREENGKHTTKEA